MRDDDDVCERARQATIKDKAGVPERIWLQIRDEFTAEVRDTGNEDVTWCQDSIYDCDEEYVHASKVDALVSALEASDLALRKCMHWMATNATTVPGQEERRVCMADGHNALADNTEALRLDRPDETKEMT